MFEKKEVEVKLADELLEFIAKWKDKPGNLIMILHKVQQTYGYIPREVALKVSRMIEEPLAKIYGVVTFYHFFKLKKPGKHMIQVCMGTACYLKGGEDLIQSIEDTLGLPVNGTTADGEFSLEAVRCVGCCGLAPVLTVDGEVFGKVVKDSIPEIISKFKGN
ncbi:MAG: NADH dehydrogenase [Lysobacterales bacterium GWF1_69_6]|nr:MAG: NADH dehydrogenase [Xanthomonadales bacterium GWF1_69_6]